MAISGMGGVVTGGVLPSGGTPRKTVGVVLALLVLIGFVLRLAPLGRYVTPDEPSWIYRSIRFRDALAAQDWSAVPSTGHPGVTTMWLGAAGVTVAQWLTPAQSAEHLNWIRSLAWLAPEGGAAFHHLAFFLASGRVAVALTTSLTLVAFYWLLKRLFEYQVALLAVGLLAFDPFLIGHSGLIHTDALLAMFCSMTVLVILNGLREPHRLAWWELAGFLSGLAVLTKTPGALAVAVGLGGAAFCSWRSASDGSGVARVGRQLTSYVLALLGVAALTVLVLNPALWSEPGSTLQELYSSAAQHVEAAQRPIFFAGQMTYDPGMAFYGVVLLFRISAVALIGLVIGLVRFSHLTSDRRVALLFSVGFAILYVIGMGLGVKKHDRYMLPALVPLALAAALGWEDLGYRVVGGLSDLSDGRRPACSLCLYGLLIVAQLVLALAFVPYPLTYANPLAGGPWSASRLLSLDWGEGMGAAARWLNGRAHAGELTVAASSVPTFGSVFTGATVPLEQAARADYVVHGVSPASMPTYVHPVAYTATVGVVDQAIVLTNTAPIEQGEYLAGYAGADDLILLDADTPLVRQYQGPGAVHSMASFPDESALAEWLEQRAPVHASTWLVGTPGASPITGEHLRRQLEAVGVPLRTDAIAGGTITQYAIRDPLPPLSASAYQAAFEGRLALVDGVVGQTAAWPDDLGVVLRWRALGQPPTDYRAVVKLRDDEGHAWSQAEMPVINSAFFPTSAWQAGHWSDATYLLPLPPGVPPGDYAVEVSLYRGDTGARLGAAGPDGRFLGTRVRVGEVALLPPEVPPSIDVLGIPKRLDVAVGPLTLLGWGPPAEEVLSGDALSFGLFWQADTAPETDHRVLLRLVASDGETEVERLVDPGPYRTSRWDAGSRFQGRYTLRVPPDVPTGRYELTLNVLSSRDGLLLESPVSLGSIQVLPRERSFTLPEEIPQPLDLTFGETVRLIGCALEKTGIAPGEDLPLTLYWQADGPTDGSYTLFVHLLGPDGRVYGQVDRVPGDGRAPTNSWAPGQVIVEEVLLQPAADAPAGRYYLAVGFYDAAYGDRLPVVQSSGRPCDERQAILPIDITVSGGNQ